MTKTYTLKVNDHRRHQADPHVEASHAHTMKTMARAMSYASSSDVECAEIHLNDRGPNGWMEHSILVQYTGGRSFYLAAIQRSPDSPTEFCS